jgi:pimeloyl-ACP methyl ester carboxylesterase
VDHGYRVIRFDNRDCGLSSKFDTAGVPDIGAALRRGMPLTAAYTLEDMAADCVGLLDALGIPKAHIVGASMGGAIAQIVAALYPQRTLSLTSIMSTSSHPDLPATNSRGGTSAVCTPAGDARPGIAGGGRHQAPAGGGQPRVPKLSAAAA